VSFSLASPFTNLRSFFDNSILASIWGLILFGLALLVFFAYYETHISSIPLLPPRLLKNKTIVGGSALGFFHFCSQFCYESFFTSFLQYVAHFHLFLSYSADSPDFVNRVARGHSPQDASYIRRVSLNVCCFKMPELISLRIL